MTAKNPDAGIHILIADDSKADRALVRRAFAKLDEKPHLHMCQDGAEVLDFLNQRGEYEGAPRPQACLMDIKMPGVSGIDALTEIKADEDLRSIVVFMFSSSDAPDDIADCYRHYANGFIKKPFETKQMEEIAAALSKLCRDVLRYPQPS